MNFFINILIIRLNLIGAIIFLFLIFNSFLYPNEPPVNITGKILNGDNSEPIANAQILVLDSDAFAISDENGYFSIKNLMLTKCRLKITHLAYQEKIVELELQVSNNRDIIIYLIPRAISLSPVVVTDKISKSKFDELYEQTNVLKGKELQQDLSLTLASTLKNETGLSVRSMGPAPSRPVIRGLGQDRVFISEDGNKTTDLSGTSPDHAVTLEPFTVNSIEVIRGPKVLSKTLTTIGGLVNIIKDEIPNEIHNTPHLTLGGYGETANKGFLGAAITEIPFDPFALRFEISKRKTDDLKTPAGTLKNSYSENFNSSAGISFIKDWGFTGASLRFFNLDYGVPGGFVGAHPNGVDIEMYRRQINIENVYNFKSIFYDKLNIKFSNTYYRHKEFESSGRLGSEFRIIDYIASAEINHRQFHSITSGQFGVSFEHRNFDIGGFVFTPPTNSMNFSAYIFENINKDRLSFDFAARYSFDNIKPEIEDPDSEIGPIKQRIFNNFSLSLSGLFQLSEKVFIGANISRSSRVPTIEDLFSEGPHLAAYSFEIGNPLLESESGIGTEVFVYHKFEKLFFNLNAFYNNLNSYIIPRNTGKINYQTFLPIYLTTGTGAVLYGFDGEVKWKLIENIFIESSISYTIGQFKDNSAYLPQIPPMKGLLEIKYSDDKVIFGINSEWAASQMKVDEFEQPTAGYIVFNMFVQYFFVTGDFYNNLSLNIDNIFNQEYRNHLSRVKSILPEAGFNIRLIYKLMI